LDNALLFLKSCRRHSATTFDEIKTSIERTNGKQFDLTSFKQILFIVPDYYMHRWEQYSSKDPQLVIELPQLGVSNQASFIEQRNQAFKEKLIEKTV
jgi:DNA replication factor CDT1 like